VWFKGIWGSIGNVGCIPCKVRSSLANEKGNQVLLNHGWGPANDRNQVSSLIDKAGANSRALLHAVKQMIEDGNEGALDELIQTFADLEIRLNLVYSTF
jgi:hypothetical protein